MLSLAPSFACQENHHPIGGRTFLDDDIANVVLE
jgi:hypothetical protein